MGKASPRQWNLSWIRERNSTIPPSAARLAGLLDSELCHLADHEISVRARGPAVPFWYDTPEGIVKVMAVDGKDAEAFTVSVQRAVGPAADAVLVLGLG